ncbi:hypothetical protein FB45DRAFT_1057722 [Roridomyces roridus]|uniref:Uncharacterized protein n=1 Tax=Roridomyces roridus TaxID=1738132 RepID=A0AAD7BX05_9AGAR|nr:hypothetical protein FB45DRAFT_1057722 [Roridomyces roridus]
MSSLPRPRCPQLRRRFSALPKLKPSPPNPTLKLLESTAALVPQVFARDSPWNGLLSSLVADLQSHPRPVRLVVCGTHSSGARDLVTALLDEPFASSQQARSLRERRATPCTNPVGVLLSHPDASDGQNRYGNPADTSENALRMPLAYLDQFPVPLEIVETTDPALLQTADVPLWVSHLEDLPALTITRPDALVAINIDPTVSQPRASTSRSTVPPAQYLYVSPSQALGALKVLTESPGSPEAVQRYQSAFVASRLPILAQALDGILTSLENIDKVRNRTALAQIRSALAACHAEIQRSRAELDSVAAGVSELNTRVEEERAKVNRDVFGSPENHAVDHALKDATDMLKFKLDAMRWRRMMWSVDEITTYLTTTMNRIWCVGLEKQLTYHAGRLFVLQRDFTERAFALLAPSNAGSLQSPVLLNKMRQLVASPTFSVTPATLIDPLNARGKQILEFPTTRLHVAGQRALFQIGGCSVAGMAISWAGWVGDLVDASNVWGIATLEPSTAMPTGVLVMLLGVHWSVRTWNRARKQWWDDLLRVSGGLKHDITEVLDKTMENQVLVVARTGCTDLSKRLVERKSELERLQEEVDALTTATEKLQK